MKKLLLIFLFCSAAYGQGSAIPPYSTVYIRTLLDDATQGTAQTTLGLGTGDSPTWAGATFTSALGLSANSAIFQPAANSTTFFQVKNAAGASVLIGDSTNRQVTIGQTSATYPFLINSADGSDNILIHHDNIDAYVRWSDGILFFRTDEGTDTESIVRISGKGTGAASLYIIDGSQYFKLRQYDTISYFETTGYFNLSATGAVRFQTSVTPDNIQAFYNAGVGYTPELQIYGYRTGDSLRSLQIGVGVDAADTASFDGLEYYLFGGRLITLNDTHEDTDGGRETYLSFKGEQSGGEQTTLARIEASHDGAADNQNGQLVGYTNDGADGDTPTEGMRLSRAGISTANDPNTLGVGVTTFVMESNVMTMTGDGAGNTIATITGAKSGTLLTLIFVDALITITDVDAHTANTVDLAGTATDFTSADDKTLQIVFDGTSWYQTGGSTN